MARNELLTILGQLDEQQISKLQEHAEKYLQINTELNDTTPDRYLAMFVAMEQFSERSSAVERIRLALTKTDSVHTITQLLNQGLLAI